MPFPELSKKAKDLGLLEVQTESGDSIFYFDTPDRNSIMFRKQGAAGVRVQCSDQGLFEKLKSRFDSAVSQEGRVLLFYQYDLPTLLEQYEKCREQIIDENSRELEERTDTTFPERTTVSEEMAANDNEGDLFVPPKSHTEYAAQIKVRAGEQDLRIRTLRSWQNRCAVTGIDIGFLIETCHIVAWRDDHDNRLNIHNTLPLACWLHGLLDHGWISFADDGKMLFSDDFAPEARQKLNLDENSKLSRAPSAEQQVFLKLHRQKFHFDG